MESSVIKVGSQQVNNHILNKLISFQSCNVEAPTKLDLEIKFNLW